MDKKTHLNGMVFKAREKSFKLMPLNAKNNKKNPNPRNKKGLRYLKICFIFIQLNYLIHLEK
tara:strand:- start:1719 stop:1904 length:186 start_codon:yes stop_codon:yes gene_type:complete